MYHSKDRGFSIIELMIVLCIIAIIAAIQIPAYVGYVRKSQLAEAFAILHPYQKEVEEYCNMFNGSGDVFVTGDGGPVKAAGMTVNFSTSQTLAGIQWFYTTAGSPPYFLIQFNPNTFPASNGTDSSYLLMYMVTNGNACNISWVCQNHPDPTFQFSEGMIPKSCAFVNTYGR